MLDRRQRAALRREVEIRAGGWGDFQFALEKGDRRYVQESIKWLRRMVDMLDAIGWSEQAGAPDKQPVGDHGRSLAPWARREARGLLSAFDEIVPEDQDLDAYSALCALGEAVMA
jgi:hypothetical protein